MRSESYYYVFAWLLIGSLAAAVYFGIPLAKFIAHPLQSELSFTFLALRFFSLFSLTVLFGMVLVEKRKPAKISLLLSVVFGGLLLLPVDWENIHREHFAAILESEDFQRKEQAILNEDWSYYDKSRLISRIEDDAVNGNSEDRAITLFDEIAAANLPQEGGPSSITLGNIAILAKRSVLKAHYLEPYKDRLMQVWRDTHSKAVRTSDLLSGLSEDEIIRYEIERAKIDGASTAVGYLHLRPLSGFTVEDISKDEATKQDYLDFIERTKAVAFYLLDKRSAGKYRDTKTDVVLGDAKIVDMEVWVLRLDSEKPPLYHKIKGGAPPTRATFRNKNFSVTSTGHADFDALESWLREMMELQ